MDFDLDHDPPELGRLRDTHSLWRFVGWGTLAATALTGAVLITQTDGGAQRLQLAFAPLSATPARLVTQADMAPQAVADKDVTKETEALRLETQSLRAEMRQLAGDRDRLNARIAGLEHSLSDMTGSIKRELSLIAATAPAPSAIERPATMPPQSDVATAGDDSTRPTAVDHNQDKSQAHFESHVDTKPQVDTETKAEQSAKPPETSATIQSVPLPPVRVASAPAAAQPGKPEIGIELGGARTMEILHARWTAVKANFGPYIEGMHPLVVHDRRPGISIPYRLMVGPLPNGAAAAQLCQRFAASRVTCRATRFAGEPLAQP